MADNPFAQPADYSVDLVYPSSFVFGQTPLQIQWAAVTAGAPPGPLTGPFNYCDLGCGDGSTLCLLAACYPEASFIGVDINPAHIELGRDRAARAGLDNVRFVLASFDDLDSQDLPELDYIVAYGVYSWLAPGMQASIGAFASRRLRTDGLLALHYSCLPGCVVRDPLNFYLRALGSATSGSSVERFASGLAALRRIAPFSGFFRQHPEADALLRSMEKASPAYVAHDILNRQLHSFHADEVHARFAGLGFSFLGSADILPNYPELLLTQPAFAAYRQLTAGADAAFRESIRDLMLRTSLRFDVFCRSGQANLPRGDRMHRIDDLYLQRAATAAGALPRRPDRSAVDLDGPLCSTLLELGSAPTITLHEIMQSSDLRTFTPADVEQAIEHLFAIGLLHVLVRRPIEAGYHSDRHYRLSIPLNALRLEETLSSTAPASLASPVLGSPLLVPPAARLQLMALLGGDMDRLWRAAGGAAGGSPDQFRERLQAGRPQFANDGLLQMLRFGIVEEIS